MKLGTFGRGAAAALIAVGIPVAVGAPAHASCATNWKSYAVSLGDSTEFLANSGCDGLWAWQADVHQDSVRGRFYKDGAWQTSSYGWKVVTTAAMSGGKIIGDTVTDRRLRGQSATYTQRIQSQY